MASKPMDYYLTLPELANEPQALREVHAWRLKIYDETKDMTLEERMARTQAASDHFLNTAS